MGAGGSELGTVGRPFIGAARDQAGQAKAKRATTARIHQRIRERLPKLPALVDTAEHYKAEQQELLAAATIVEVGQVFTFHDTTYRRTQTNASLRTPGRYVIHKALIENTATGERIDVTKTEGDAFWSWAIIETLRHTGVRLEELGEITTWHWSPTGSPTPAKSSPCCRSCLPRPTKNAFC